MVYYEDMKVRKEYTIKRRIGKGNSHEPHYHHLLEIDVIQKNDVRYQFGSREIYGKEGDVFLCRPFEPHWSYVTDPDQPYHSILLNFTPAVVRKIPMGPRLLAPYYSMMLQSPLIPSASSYAKAIQQASEQAVAESEQRGIAWEAREYIRFVEILIYIYEYFSSLHEHKEDAMVDDEIIGTIGYIVAHIAEDLTADLLMDKLKIGKTAFFQKFKRLTGLTPNHFINRIRLQIAADLLIRTDRSVTDICLESGFPSLSTFNKQFKPFYSASPAEFRRQASARQMSKSTTPAETPYAQKKGIDPL